MKKLVISLIITTGLFGASAETCSFLKDTTKKFGEEAFKAKGIAMMGVGAIRTKAFLDIVIEECEVSKSDLKTNEMFTKIQNDVIQMLNKKEN